MILYVRDRSQFINFIKGVSELRDFAESYVPGTSLVIGDLATFSGPMRSMLLKLLEDNPSIDCYSSEDIVDSVLLSRFTRIVKEPLVLRTSHSEKDFLQGNRSYVAAVEHLDISDSLRLLSVGASKFEVSLLCFASGRSNE